MKKTFCIILSLGMVFTAFGQNQKKNLGKPNSPEVTDGSPFMSADGNQIYYRKSATASGTDYKPYVTTRQADNTWSEGQLIKEWDEQGYDGVCYVYADGNAMILPKNGTGKEGGFSKMYRTANGWSKAERLEFESLPFDKWFAQGCSLTPDGKVMIMANNMVMYVSYLKDGHIWTKPELLSDLDTPGNEYTPIFSSDYKTLYFSSDGRSDKIGDNDIYKTYPLDHTYTKWAVPQNLGPTVNTPAFDNYFSVSAKGDFAIMYSRGEGNGDIFIMPLIEENRPDPVVLLSGRVIDASTNQTLAAKIYYENLTDRVAFGEGMANPTDGKYNIVFPYGKKYGFRAELEGYYAISDNIDLTQSTGQYQEIQKDIKMYPITKGQTIVLNNLFFDFGKSELLPASYPELERLIEVLQSDKSIKIMIAGHTDDKGADALNLTLSQNRANAVVKYLVEKGINASRLSAKGFGKSKPIVANDSDTNRQQNRRVEFNVL
ncbi:OmpA family protein [Rhodocytophaga rosea]|uniref:OmpA family protein n=1 Tax=Rhodocytophaga rosea TaxID=2704465 RepID=A0A6C0GTU1_9BACT|nr:OmpA family protein [Rhodocytophaga rosea]QHT71589.1 OmpA family protein [Rhodocytophaga rosea]